MVTRSLVKPKLWWTALSLFIWSVVFGVLIGAVRNQQSTPSEYQRSTANVIHPLYPATEVFDRALQAKKSDHLPARQPILGMVVNHHLIAADFITDTLRYAQGQDIDRIILLAPNHFFAGHGYFMTTKDTFSTPFGEVVTDQSTVTSLLTKGVGMGSVNTFQHEHGIYNVLPFINQQLPHIPIVPIITREGAPEVAIDSLRRELSNFITRRTLIIASLDFAHNQTNDGANALDNQSLQLLAEVDPGLVQPNVGQSIAVDSPMTLRLFLSLLRDRGATTFTLLHHSNSALETGHLDAADVTSHIAGIFSVPSEIK